MPRQPRREYPDSLYHAVNRGIEQRPIVADDEDRRAWFRLFDRVVRRYDWRVFAYVLLDNHFHLYFRIRTANLSIGMHDFESGYATLFNKRHRRVGALFQGRFKSVLVENQSHSWELTRYLHLNPVRARMTADPMAHAWSSYRYYLNPRGAPPWLDWKTVLAEIGGTEAAGRVAYKRFVDAGIRQPPPSPLDQAVDGWILGSEEFVTRIRAVADDAGGVEDIGTGELTLEVIARAVQEVFSVSSEQVRARGRRINLPREATILLARDRTAETIERIGQFFGVGGSAISETARRARQRAERDASFRESLDRAGRLLER